MKRFFLVFLFLLMINKAESQSMDSFFSNIGNELLATLAHPTNKFMYANYEIRSNTVWLDIHYENYHTKLEINRSGNFFTNIEIVYDNDWISPFSGVEMIKDFVMESIKDQSDAETKNEFEQKIEKIISEMNGIELSCLVLTLGWLDY